MAVDQKEIRILVRPEAGVAIAAVIGNKQYYPITPSSAMRLRAYLNKHRQRYRTTSGPAYNRNNILDKILGIQLAYWPITDQYVIYCRQWNIGRLLDNCSEQLQPFAKVVWRR